MNKTYYWAYDPTSRTWAELSEGTHKPPPGGKVCLCYVCENAFKQALGSNYNEVFGNV